MFFEQKWSHLAIESPALQFSGQLNQTTVFVERWKEKIWATLETETEGTVSQSFAPPEIDF